jgi:hypothetical protein
MGRQGKRRRKPARHLPKVQGNPGRLWGDEPTPWVAGGEAFQRSIGRAGPKAQAAYFRGRPRLMVGFRIAGLVVAALAVLAAVVVVVR